ncbi:Cytochrome b subunit of the bc complex [Hydrogenobacter hydrogenophilus]|uniref:Cytochrome b subunit of the bc complex n=2 Tax=Hydrogenobacter hydrogenophilus TaxID=35835 RepID=A0A285P4M3_9AQUI|nr:Cytochrome b subunit of the bc complex [Hydrogenobacter hydrogenophilus]
MIKPGRLYANFQRLTYPLSGLFSSRYNPFYHLGAIAVFLLVIDVISGVYLFFFYSIDPQTSHASVEAISRSFLGSIMRGIHRYSSDALILTTLAHMLHVIITDRFRMFRWVAWVTGVATLLIFLAIGVSGYILVWDTKAQLTGLLTAKFFSFLPVFGDALMSAFLGGDIKYLGGLFRILLFAHIALTILIVFTLWVHVMRNARPRLIPPRFLYITITLLLIALSVLFPAKSDPPAYINKLPFEMSVDWFYLFGYPLLKYIPMSVSWLIFTGFFAFLFLFPWLLKGRRNPPAHIDFEKCTGCEQCYIDCPYEAITMKNLDHEKKAILNENKCAGCGICVGSCSVQAIDIPTFPVDEVMERIRREKPSFVVFRCPFSALPSEREGLLTFTLPCAGALNTFYAEEVLSAGVKGIIVVSCEYEDCYFREGNKWLEERYERKRRPILKKKVEGGRILILEAPLVKSIDREVEEFINSLKEGKEVRVITSGKVNYALASLVLALPAFLFYPLTTHRISFYPTDKSVLVLSFKYRSSPVIESFTQEGKGLKHMQAKTAIVKERSPVKVEVYQEGRLIYSKVFNPRGIRKDTSVFVYEELFLQPGMYNLTVRLMETKGKKDVKEIKLNAKMKASDSLLLSYNEEAGGFVVLR